MKIKNKIQFTIASKNIKNRGINLTKDVQNLYTENYKSLLRLIKEGLTTGSWVQYSIL